MKIADRVSIWKNKPFDKETIKKVIELEKNEDELNERFHSIHIPYPNSLKDLQII